MAWLLLILLTLRAQTLVVCSVSVDGQPPFRVPSIYPNQRVYLEAAPLARQMRWSLVDRPDSQAILLDGKSLKDVQRLRGATYVSAEEVAKTFGYRYKESSNGLVVDFVTGTRAANPTGLQLRSGKVEKLTSPNPEYYQVRLSVYLKNPGKDVIVLNSRGFFVTDHNQQKVYCSGSFDITVRPGEEIRVERLYFDVPKRSTLRKVGLEDSQGNLLGSAGL